MRRYFSVAGGLAWRLLHTLATNPLLFLPPMLMPIFFFTAFAGGLSAISNAPGFDYGPGYTSFIFAFVLCQSAAFGGVFSGFSIAADFQFGFGRRLLLATPHRSALLIGYGVVALIRAVITLTAVTLIGLAVGMNMNGGGLDVFGMYGLAAIINVTGLLFAAGVALRFRSLQATPLMQVPVFLFLFLAPVYVPRELLGGWVHAVAPFNPATHVMETVRDLLAGTGTDYLATLGHHRGAARGGLRLRDARPAPGRGRGLAPLRDPPVRPALRAVSDQLAPAAAVAGDEAVAAFRCTRGARRQGRERRAAGEQAKQRLEARTRGVNPLGVDEVPGAHPLLGRHLAEQAVGLLRGQLRGPDRAMAIPGEHLAERPAAEAAVGVVEQRRHRR